MTTPAVRSAVADPTADLPLLRGEAFSGALLLRLVVAAGAWVVLGSFAGGLLALAGIWQPVVAGPVLLVLAAIAVRLSALVPARPMAVWAAVLVAGLAIGSTLWAGLTHSEQVLPRRDSGSYLQSAVDLARGHDRPVQVAAASVGGPEVLAIPGITLASPAFYETGTDEHPVIQPQFPVGPSVWYSLAWWVGGTGLVFWVPPVFGGLAVLGAGLLAALTIGHRWAPLATLGVALLFPLLHVSRSTYSEPLALLVLAAAMVALTQAARAAGAGDAAAARWSGGIAGGLLGGGVLLRVDTLREVILLVAVGTLAALQRQPHARPLLTAAAAATATGGALTWLTSSEYLRGIGGSLLPLAAGGLVVVLGGAVVVRLARRGAALPEAVRARLPRVAAGLVVVVSLVLASRPLWLTVRQSAEDPGARVVAGLQLRQGLPVDGGRTYAEQTLVWTSWWVGPIALGLALAGAAVLVHRAASAWTQERPLPPWAGPLLLGLGSAVLTWYRPGITPDHPWADRRLVVVLPTVVLLVVAVAATLTRWSTRRMPAPVLVASSVLSALALLVPTALATWPHATERVEHGELGAVEQVCRAFRPGEVALMVDSRAANEWPQVLRGQCGVPALSTTAALRRDEAALADAVEAVRAGVEARGGRLVLLAADTPVPVGEPGRLPDQALRALGAASVEQVLDQVVLEDDRLLERRPDGLVELPLQVWLGRPSGPAS